MIIRKWIRKLLQAQQEPPYLVSGDAGTSQKYPDGIMDKPSKVKALTIDSYFGGLPKDSNPARSEYFIGRNRA